jgi:hypothetical protein
MVTATTALRQGQEKSLGGGSLPSDGEMQARVSRRLAGFFFWTGIVMSVLSILLIVYRDAKLIWPWEQGTIPLSWLLAGAAALAFLATEIAHAKANRKNVSATDSLPVPEEGSAARISKQEFLSLMEQEFDRFDNENTGAVEAALLTPLPSPRQNRNHTK